MEPLQIPEGFVPGFVALAGLDRERFERLADALGSAPLVDRATLAEQVVVEAADVDLADAHSIVTSLISLFGYHRRARESLDEVATGVARSPELASLSEDQRAELEPRIQQLLGTRSIGGTAKAADLQNHRYAVQSIQIVTETRFLFDDEDLDPFDAFGAVLSHTLRVQAVDEDRDTVFTLTDQGLRDLEAEVSRAMSKREMIGGRLRDGGFQIYDDQANGSA